MHRKVQSRKNGSPKDREKLLVLSQPLVPLPPTLSICIPTYNRARWLRISLASLASQVALAKDKVELVISDNCSTDESQQIIEEMQKVCPIRYHRNETNIGANPNFCLLASELARGRYVWMLGDDDIVRPDGVERVLSALEDHPDLNYFYVNYTRWPVEKPPDAALLPHEFPGLNPAGNNDLQDKYVRNLFEIAAGDYSCFTPIYCSVLRRSDAERAYRVDPKVPAFSSLESISPQAIFIADHLLDKPAWYIGYPCVVTTPPQGWESFRPTFILNLLPLLYDKLQKNGVPAQTMNAHRRFILTSSHPLISQVLTERGLPFWGRGSLWQFAWRFRRFPEVWRLVGWGFALKIYLAGPAQPLRALWRRVKGRKSDI